MASNFCKTFAKHLGYQNINPGMFYTFQWRLPPIVFVVYRITLAIYTSVSLSLVTGEGWSVYFTYWTYVLETIFYVMYALLVVWMLLKSPEFRKCLFRRLPRPEFVSLFQESIIEGYDQLPSENMSLFVQSSGTTLPWYYALVWIPFNVVSASSIVVSVVFWFVLVPRSSDIGKMTYDNIQLHIINSVVILLEHAVTAVPIRLLHCLYPMIYVLIYVLFSLFYWVDDHSHVIYYLLNWNYPGYAIGYIALIELVAITFGHIVLFYGWYKLKMWIFHKIYN